MWDFMLPINLVLLIIFAHWVSDFVMQTDQMALNKSTSIKWLTYHVIAYMLSMFIIILVIWGSVNAYWILLNGALHWSTDFVTSKISSWLWRNERRHDFFVMVGFDQLIHYACLLLTATWMITLGVNVF
jgi:hypothetical protein